MDYLDEHSLRDWICSRKVAVGRQRPELYVDIVCWQAYHDVIVGYRFGELVSFFGIFEDAGRVEDLPDGHVDQAKSCSGGCSCGSVVKRLVRHD